MVTVKTFPTRLDNRIIRAFTFLLATLQPCYIHAEPPKSRLLSTSEGLEVLDSIAVEHGRQIERLGDIEFDFDREVVHLVDLGFLQKVRSVGHGHEIRSGNLLNSKITWEQHFLTERPKKAVDHYEQRLVMNDKQMGLWVVGNPYMQLWEWSSPDAYPPEMQSRLLQTRCHLIPKIFGDGNLLLPELLELARTSGRWNLEVEEVPLAESSNGHLYLVREIDLQSQNTLYREFTINSNKGFTVEEIRTFLPSAAIAQSSQHEVYALADGVWWPRNCSVIEFEDPEMPSYKRNPIRLEARITTSNVVLRPNIPSVDFELANLSVENGTRCKVVGSDQLVRNEFFFEGGLVDIDTYRELNRDLESSTTE